MIAAPHTYAEWASVLDVLKAKSNDEDVLEAMKSGSIEWQSGIAERFSKRLIDSVNARMNAATDKFQKDIKRPGDTERVVVQAMLALRKELSFLSQVMDIPALPEDRRQEYVKLVREQAEHIQKSLEDSAKKDDRTGKMASIVRNHKVNAF